jgi:hypothetical protein
MTRMHQVEVLRKVRTAELEAVAVLRKIRENGAKCLSRSTGAFTFTAPGVYRVNR